jgi:hypothetical protein
MPRELQSRDETDVRFDPQNFKHESYDARLFMYGREWKHYNSVSVHGEGLEVLAASVIKGLHELHINRNDCPMIPSEGDMPLESALSTNFKDGKFLFVRYSRPPSPAAYLEFMDLINNPVLRVRALSD